MIDFKNMDCLEYLKSFPSSFFDLVIIDPPYVDLDNCSQNKRLYYDFNFGEKFLNYKEIKKEMIRTLRFNGKVVIFGNLKTLLKWSDGLEYMITDEAFWEKESSSNFLSINRSLLHIVEPIMIMTNKNNSEGFKKCKEIMMKAKTEGYQDKYKEMYNDYMHSHYFTNIDGQQFSKIPKEKWEDLGMSEGLEMSYDEFLKIYEEEKKQIKPTVFNRLYNEKGKTLNNLFKYNRPKNKTQITQKPIELISQLIEIYSNPGDNVIDFFAGSGTSLIASDRLGRNGYGCEKDKERYENAVKRIKEEIKEA